MTPITPARRAGPRRTRHRLILGAAGALTVLATLTVIVADTRPPGQPDPDQRSVGGYAGSDRRGVLTTKPFVHNHFCEEEVDVTDATAERPGADELRVRLTEEPVADGTIAVKETDPGFQVSPPSRFYAGFSLTILEVVRHARHGLTAAEIAKACHLSPHGRQKLLLELRDLCRSQYLWHWDNGRYTLGPAIVERFADFATQLRDLRKSGASITDVVQRPRCLLKYLLARGVCTCGVRHRARTAR
jgi:hypothetical protein